MIPTAVPFEASLVKKPLPYDPPLFVDRDTELDLIKKKVQTAQSRGTVSDPVVNFWGVHGIGKTWLLQHLYHVYRYPGEQQGRSFGTFPSFCLLHTFTDPKTASLPNLASALTDDMTSQLSNVLTTEHKEALIEVKTSGKLTKLVRVISELSELPERFVPLILLDGVENVADKTWIDLERKFIEPLVSSGHVLFVIAGRRKVPRWRRFEVRRRVMPAEETQVQPFDKRSVEKQVNQRDYRIPVNLLFPYTAGNPHLVDVVSKQMLAWTKGVEPNQASFERHQDGILRILRAYENQLMEGVSPDLRRVLGAVSSLRFFRLESLRYMLDSQDPQDSPQPDLYYLNILRALEQQTEVVWWSRERRAYMTDKMVRQVINRRQLLEDAKVYSQLHRSAFQLYWTWSREYPGLCEDFIVEVWFHAASLFQADQDRNLLRSSIDEARNFAKENLSTDHLLILHKQYEGDSELHNLLTNDLHRELDQALERALDHKVR